MVLTVEKKNQILIAKDDPVATNLLMVHLAAASHEILTATDGDEALDIIKEEGVRIVISDGVMPQANGLQLCKAVRAMQDHQIRILHNADDPFQKESARGGLRGGCR